MKIFDIASYSLDHLNDDELNDMLKSELSVIAGPDESAIDLANKAEQTEGGMVIVVDLDQKPIGIVDPYLVLQLYKENKGISANRLGEALDILSGDPDEQVSEFHHEWLNHARVDPYWCQKGKHRSMYKVCPYHSIA